METNPTFFFGTPWVAPIGFIFQTMLLIAIIWFPKTRKIDDEYRSKYIKAIRGFPMALFLFFGVLYIDVFINVVLLGGYSPAAWAQTYPSAFLALVLGVEWITMAAFVSPNVKTLASTIAYIIAYIVYVKLYVPTTRDAWSIIPFLGVMAALGGVHVIMLVVEGILKRIMPRFSGDKPLWNVRPRFKRLFNVPVNVVLWGLVTTEALLQFVGYSLITVFM
jgi:hypothetical protein